MMMEETIKICNKNEVRRVVIHDSTTFSECVQVIKRIFPIMNDKTIHLLWKDEEQDFVTISTNEEFQEARKIMKTMALGIPKFIVKVIKDTEIKEEVVHVDVSVASNVPDIQPEKIHVNGNNVPDIQPEKIHANGNNVPDIQPEKIHANVQCDECQIIPIVGVRYKCTVRHNFDLCAKCEGKAIQPYPMVKIFRPRQRPNHEQMLYKMLNVNAGPTILSSNDKVVSVLEQSKKFNHHHVRCDECLMSPIIGTRFKCTTRENFDLCFNCEGKKLQPYPMVKIYDPKHNPSFLQYKMKCHPHADAKWRDKNHHHHQHHQHGKVTFVNAMQDFFQANLSSVKVEKFEHVSNNDVNNNVKPAMRFVKDVTFPDGATVTPGQTFQKVWKVRNDGTTAWPEGVILTTAGGDEVIQVVVNNLARGAITITGALNVGEEKDLSATLTAPEKEGRYVSYFRLQTKEGRNFGQRLWADFVVVFNPATASVTNLKSETTVVGGGIDVATIDVVKDYVSNSVTSSADVDDSSSLVVNEKLVNNSIVNNDSVSVEEVDGNWVNIQDPAVCCTSTIDVTLVVEEDNEEEEPLFYPLHSSICYEDDSCSETSGGGGASSTNAVAMTMTGDHLDEDNYSRWKKELLLLTEMGFSDVEMIIPLLEQHLNTPAPANTAGLQQVVATLLRIQDMV